MPPSFDVAAHPPLVELGNRLRDLAGEAAYNAGRDYRRKGLVRDGLVTGVTVSATVAGSSDYRVTVALSEDARVTCSCPAHRRSRHCKHVVAVCVALLEEPGGFHVAETTPPPAAKPLRRKPERGAKERAAKTKAEQQAAGLAMVDRLLDELVAGGVGSLGPEQLALIANAAETVRGLKLRRLGNRLHQVRLLVERGGADAAPRRTAALLADIALIRQSVGAYLVGRLPADSADMEELVGRTWREKELPRLGGLDLMAVAKDEQDDGEFRICSCYLADLASGELFVERQITPRGLRGGKAPDQRLRLLVDEAGVYPGGEPRRIKPLAVRRAPLTTEHVDRLLLHAPAAFDALRARLVETLGRPFGPREMLSLVRPAGLVARRGRVAMVDCHGCMVPLDWPEPWTKLVTSILPEPGRFALAGLVRLDGDVLAFRTLSVVGHLDRPQGPVYPD